MKKQENKKPEPEKKPAFPLGKFIAAHVLTLSGVLVGILLLLGTGVVLAQNMYKQKFFPGVKIGELSVAGLSYTEALEKIQPSLLALETTGLQFQSGDTALTVPATLEPVDPGAGEKTIFSVDADATVEAAYSVGRTGSFIFQLGEQVKTALQGVSVPVAYSLDEEELASQLEEAFSGLEQRSQNASLVYDAENGEWSVEPAADGQVFNYTVVLSEAHERFQQAVASPVHLQLQAAQPEVTDEVAERQIELADQILKLAPIQIHADSLSFEIGEEEFARWIEATPQGIGLDAEEVAASLEDRSDLINQPAKEGRFNFVDGKIEQYEDSQEGKVLDIPVSIGFIQQQIIDDRTSEATLYVRVDQPNVTPENIADLGIKELLGTGHSNMGNSPYNRRLNIARGAELLNGLLIAPGEEFSLLDHLRPFTSENGYYPELVIKENKTIPEIGGGLCQIGTTTFRGAMLSGFEILERRNHSYAVSYYFDDANNLPGTDATIYDPSPDMRFKNDTGHWVLFEAKIESNDLYFSFYGTSDGRKAFFTPPTISGWVSPPPTKEVEDPSLAPGAKKCTESAHAGTSSSFDYIIEYADGTKHEETFTSIYKPWQAVCLVGPKPEAAPATDTGTTEDSTDSENVAPPVTDEPETSAPTTDTKPKKKKN
ncbi:MAG: VanW family protein [Patescibacteria group bacterium]